MSPDGTGAGAGRDGEEARRNRVALLVAACFFMEILDGTIVVTSAPQIGADLGVGSGAISLVMTAYLVTVAALIPQSGWLAARFGSRRVFLSAIVVFTVASLGCALSTTLAELVAMRVLQGVGAAMMVPVGRHEVLGNTPKSELMKVMSFLIWPGPGGAGDRAAGRRPDHHLRQLALDLPRSTCRSASPRCSPPGA